MDRLTSASEALLERYRSLSTPARVVLWAWISLQWLLIGVFVSVGPSRIFEGEQHRSSSRAQAVRTALG